ncbi:glycine zipper 2TM domain-containing protein [Sulfurimonas sp.]
MRKYIFINIFLALFLFSGCSTSGEPQYEEIRAAEFGIVVKSQGLRIKDSGIGRQIGATIGSLLGSFVGEDKVTNTLAILGGSIAGGYIGAEIGKADANELTINLDEGDSLMLITKNLDIVVGDRVEIIRDGDNSAQINKIDY